MWFGPRGDGNIINKISCKVRPCILRPLYTSNFYLSWSLFLFHIFQKDEKRRFDMHLHPAVTLKKKWSKRFKYIFTIIIYLFHQGFFTDLFLSSITFFFHIFSIIQFFGPFLIGWHLTSLLVLSLLLALNVIETYFSSKITIKFCHIFLSDFF